MNKNLRHLMLLLPVLLAGCVVLSHSHLYGSDVRQFLSYAGAERDFNVVVVGNPFGDDKAAVDKVVTDALNRQFAYLNGNFTTSPGDSARSAYKMVAVFDPRQINTHDLCADPASAGGGPAGERMAIIMVFCGHRPFKEATVMLPRADSVNHRDLRTAIDMLALELDRDLERFDRDHSDQPTIVN